MMRTRLLVCLGLSSLLACNLPAGGGPGLEPPGDNSGFGNSQGRDLGVTGTPSDPPPPVINDPANGLNDPIGGAGTAMSGGAGGTGGTGGAGLPDEGMAGTASPAGMNGDPNQGGSSPPPPPTAGGSAGGGSGSLSRDAGVAPPEGSVRCDDRDVICDLDPPPCVDAFHVHEIVDGCYGACVPIEACACDGPDACPDPNQYTCIASQQHCSPYL